MLDTHTQIHITSYIRLWQHGNIWRRDQGRGSTHTHTLFLQLRNWYLNKIMKMKMNDNNDENNIC